MNNETFFDFHSELMGYNLFKNGKFVPKYIAYWTGHNSEDILCGRHDIKAVRG